MLCNGKTLLANPIPFYFLYLRPVPVLRLGFGMVEALSRSRAPALPHLCSGGRWGLCLYPPWWGGGLTFPQTAAPACLRELESLRPSVFWACPTAISHSSALWTTLWVLLQGGDFPTTVFCFLTMPVISVLNSMVSFSSLFSYAAEELSSNSQA